MIPPVQALPRSRNAAATREAILASARKHFARENYENVGLREIAGDAGVDPALVSRYFGSKEALFRETIDTDILEPIARVLGGQDTEMRAAMAFAVLMGMGIMHNTLAIDPDMCTAEETERFEKRLTRIFAAALEPMDD